MSYLYLYIFLSFLILSYLISSYLSSFLSLYLSICLSVFPSFLVSFYLSLILLSILVVGFLCIFFKQHFAIMSLHIIGVGRRRAAAIRSDPRACGRARCDDRAGPLAGPGGTIRRGGAAESAGGAGGVPGAAGGRPGARKSESSDVRDMGGSGGREVGGCRKGRCQGCPMSLEA